jgi:Bacterial PH domain
VRITPNTDGVPPRVNILLLPHERQVISVHQHPARIIPSLVTATGGLLAAVVVTPVVKGNDALEAVIWLLVVILMAQVARAVLDWLSYYLVVTSSRVLIISGFRSPEVTWSAPLANIQDITLRRSIGDRIYGSGTLVFPSEHLAIDYIPYPEQLYLEITGLLFRTDTEETQPD